MQARSLTPIAIDHVGGGIMAFSTLDVDGLLAKSEISALDVVRLRDALTHEGPVSEAEARALLTIELSPVAKALTWKALFLDAMTAFAIHDSPPDGYLTADKADWLLRIAAPQGRILSGNIFELLTTILAAARWAPQRLVSALLDEVYCAVASGDGPLREGVTVAPGVITERDTEVVRRILYSAGKSDVRSITRGEAAGLIAVDTACAGSTVHPAWVDLFCKAMFDAAMVASHRTGLVREMFLSPGPQSSDPAQARVHLSRIAKHYRPQTQEDLAVAALERQRLAIVTGDEVEVCTADWLGAVFVRDKSGSSARVVLMGLLAEERANLDPRLRPVLDAPASGASRAA